MWALSQTRIEAITEITADFDRALAYSGSQAARSKSAAIGRQIIYGDLEPGELEPEDFTPQVHNIGAVTMMVLHGCAVTQIGETTCVLSRSDLQRVHQFLSGLKSGLFATVAQACVAPGRERELAVAIGAAYEGQVSRLLDGAVTVPPGDEVYICKAFKRAFGAFLGELSGPLCRDETTELWAETLETRHAEKLDLTGWVIEIRRWSASTAFNLGKVYKLCPAPDACPGLTLLERHEMVCNHNSVDPTMILKFARVHRDQVLRAYIRQRSTRLELRDDRVRPTWWQAYKSRRFDEVPTAEIHEFLKWESTATMPARSPDNPALWKDSGLGWDTYEQAVDPERIMRHGNMLTRMVFDSSAPMPGTRHVVSAHDHKIDTKPEGHKDPARGIYSGNLPERLNQSWMEAAVQEVAQNHPSFMIGADSATREGRVKAIVSRSMDPAHVDLYYSFDIAGWSPRMPPEPQHISHNLWAELYDEQLFRSAHTITDGSRVYMNKQGFRAWYINPGTNLEGYNGKEMTMILVSLMALTVEEWRTDIVAKGLCTRAQAGNLAAVLLAYIDDGLAKLTLPRATAMALFDSFKACTVATFGACGYTIEMSKCYPSDRFAVFLNEPYLAGRHVTHGTRAAMTICAENTETHTTLLERVSSVSTGCRGAVMSGLDALAGLMLQAYHTHQHVLEWIRNPDPVAAALWAYAPRAWGGLGLPSALQLGTSGGGAAIEESIHTLQKWAEISLPARKFYLVCAREQFRPRNPMGILLAPLGGRLTSGVMVETRVPDAVREALKRLASDSALSRLAMSFLEYSSPESLSAFAERLLPMKAPTVLQEQLLADLAACHPHAIFSAFARRIEKSSTLMSLLGRRKVNEIIRQNRLDATSSYAEVRARLR
jgi:hypothetical protein